VIKDIFFAFVNPVTVATFMVLLWICTKNEWLFFPMAAAVLAALNMGGDACD
jgi:hypothetical protein